MKMQYQVVMEVLDVDPRKTIYQGSKWFTSKAAAIRRQQKEIKAGKVAKIITREVP